MEISNLKRSNGYLFSWLLYRLLQRQQIKTGQILGSVKPEHGLISLINVSHLYVRGAKVLKPAKYDQPKKVYGPKNSKILAAREFLGP